MYLEVWFVLGYDLKEKQIRGGKMVKAPPMETDGDFV